MDTWNLKQLTGLFLVFILLDLIALIFRTLNYLIIEIVLVIFVAQIIYLFYLNAKHISHNDLKSSRHLYLLSIIVGIITVFWIYMIFLESAGLNTILGDVIKYATTI